MHKVFYIHGSFLPKLVPVEWSITMAIRYRAAQMHIYRFIEYHQLLWCRVTNHIQEPPINKQPIADFVSYINDEMKMEGIDDCYVVNFDETNYYFSPDFSYTIADCRNFIVALAKPDIMHCYAWKFYGSRTVSLCYPQV